MALSTDVVGFDALSTKNLQRGGGDAWFLRRSRCDEAASANALHLHQFKTKAWFPRLY
jgi:hypothetical protein